MKRDNDEDGRRPAVDKVGGESDRGLLIIDMSFDRVRGSAAVVGAEDLVRFIQGELRYFRERGRPVFFATGLTSRERNTAVDAVIPELTPRSGEIVLTPPTSSAFVGTDLDQLLQKCGVRRLTLVGLETDTAVLRTANDAVAHGYEAVVPEPCVCSHDVVAHHAALHLLRAQRPLRSAAQVSTPNTADSLRQDL